MGRDDHSCDEETFKLFEALYHDYVRRIGETWDETTKRILDAQQRWRDSVTAANRSADLHGASEAANGEYVEAVRAAWDASQEAYSAAFDCYVRGYHAAWSKLPSGDVSPVTMAIVGQSACTAASYASGTIGNGALIAWAGVPPSMLAPACGQDGDVGQRAE